MAITRPLLGPNIRPRPYRVLDCIGSPVGDRTRCGWRCLSWIETLGYSDYRVAAEDRAYMRANIIQHQLTAELCEATPEPFRDLVRNVLVSHLLDDKKQLFDLSRRARFMLTTPDPSQQAIAASMLGDFAGTWRQFASTVRATAA